MAINPELSCLNCPALCMIDTTIAEINIMQTLFTEGPDGFLAKIDGVHALNGVLTIQETDSLATGSRVAGTAIFGSLKSKEHNLLSTRGQIEGACTKKRPSVSLRHLLMGRQVVRCSSPMAAKLLGKDNPRTSIITV